MRRLPIKNLLLFGFYFLGIFHSQSIKGCFAAQTLKAPGASSACDETLSDDEGSFTLTVSSNEPVCNTYVSGPNNSVVLLTFTIPAEPEGNDIILEISDEWADGNTTLFRYNGTGSEVEVPTTNLYSFSSTVLLALESSGEDFSMTFSYIIVDRSNMTTVLNNGSGKLEVTGDSNNYINFQHTWKVSAGEDNFLIFFINNVTLDDSAGDFLAIGTGSEVFAEAPALMLTSQWLDYPRVHLNGTEGYIQLFMKSYSPQMGISLYYHNWVYTPPTLLPPFTKPTLDIIDAYFYFDDSADNYRDVVTNFTKYVEKYAYQYCDWDPATSGHDHLPDYPLVLDVEVAQVVESNPCLVVEFTVDILNGSCLKDILFSKDDFQWLLGNYSSQLNSDFGRDVMLSCPMKLLWVIAVVVIMFVTVLVIIFVGFKSIDIDKTGLLSDQDDEEGEDSEDTGDEHEREEDPESGIQDVSHWLKQAEPNQYNYGLHPTAPRDSDDDSLERQKEEAYKLNSKLESEYRHKSVVHGENFELVEARPQLNRLKSVTFQNDHRIVLAQARARNLRTFDGVANEGYTHSDDELDDIQEDESYYNIYNTEGIYEEVHRLPQNDSSPSTSSSRSTTTYM